MHIFATPFIVLRSQVNRDCSSHHAHALSCNCSSSDVLRYLQHISSIRHSLPRPALLSLLVHFVTISKLVCCCTVLASVPETLLRLLQLFLNAAARLVLSASKYSHECIFTAPRASMAQSAGVHQVPDVCADVPWWLGPKLPC